MSAAARIIPRPEGGRVKTGPVQFGDDLPGVFIRFENAECYATCLAALLRGQTLPGERATVGMLLALLRSCEVKG